MESRQSEIVEKAIILGAVPEESRAAWNAMLDSQQAVQARAALNSQIKRRKADLGLESIQDIIDNAAPTSYQANTVEELMKEIQNGQKQ